MDDSAVRDLVKRFFDAIEQGDVETVASCYTDDAVIWHNFDNIEQSREDNLNTLRGMVGRISDRDYGERRLEIFKGGFVHQHVLRGTRQDGVRLEMPAIIICRLREGKIARLDEYLDSAHVAAFRKKMA